MKTPAFILEQKRRYYIENRDSILAQQLRYRVSQGTVPRPAKTTKTKDELRAAARIREAAWRARNPEYLRLKSKRYYATNKEKASEHLRQWQKNHRARISEYHKLRRARRKGCFTDGTADIFIRHVRSQKRIRCYYCKEWVSGKEAHIDHVIAVSKQGNHASDNLCASCPKCNMIKHARLPSDTRFNNQPLLNI